MKMNFEEKEMHRLEALKAIAELLNEATDLQDMLEKALHTLLQVMNLKTGGIFFIDEREKHGRLGVESTVCLWMKTYRQLLRGKRRSRCVKETAGV